MLLAPDSGMLGHRHAGQAPKALLLDLDGVVYSGEAPLPHAAATIGRLRAQGVAVRYITNNASRTAGEVTVKLRGVGVEAEAHEVLTSSMAAVEVLRLRCEAGLMGDGPIAVVGGKGLLAPLQGAGFDTVPVTEMSQLRAAALVQGFTPEVTWHDLAAATRLVRSGVWWLATNLDLTLPTEHGPAPGNGSLVRAITTAAGRGPDASAGKPAPAMFEQAGRGAEVSDPADVLVVGDRLDTDIAGAVGVDYPSLLVLTGVHGLTDLLVAPPGQRPRLVGLTMADIDREHPQVVVSAPGRATCRAASAVIDRAVPDRTDVRMTSDSGAADAHDPDHALDMARALVAAAWSLSDKGAAVLGHPDVIALDVALRRHAMN